MEWNQENVFETFDVKESMNMWATIFTFNTTIGTFDMYRNGNDINGNPKYKIVPRGYTVSDQPKLKGFRKNKDGWSCTSHNYTQTFAFFLASLNVQLDKGNRLYVNFPKYVR